jgi:hypothetical protein
MFISAIREAAMRDKDLIDKVRENLEKLRKLPAKEQLERMVKRGVIDKDGRVRSEKRK